MASRFIEATHEFAHPSELVWGPQTARDGWAIAASTAGPASVRAATTVVPAAMQPPNCPPVLGPQVLGPQVLGPQNSGQVSGAAMFGSVKDPQVEPKPAAAAAAAAPAAAAASAATSTSAGGSVMVHIYNSLPRTSQPAPWQTCDLDSSDNGAMPAPSKRKDSTSNLDLKALRQSTAAALAAATAAVKASRVCAKMEKMHGETVVEVKPKSSGRQKRRAQPATAASQEATEPEMKASRGQAQEAAEEDEENPPAQHGNEDGEEGGGEDEDMEDNGDGNDNDDADGAASDVAGAPVSTQLDAPSAPAQLGNVCAISDAVANEDVADKITGKVTGQEVPGPQVLCPELQPQEECPAKGKGRGKGGRGKGRSRGPAKASSKKKDKASPKKRSDLKTQSKQSRWRKEQVLAAQEQQ